MLIHYTDIFVSFLFHIQCADVLLCMKRLKMALLGLVVIFYVRRCMVLLIIIIPN